MLQVTQAELLQSPECCRPERVFLTIMGRRKWLLFGKREIVDVEFTSYSKPTPAVIKFPSSALVKRFEKISTMSFPNIVLHGIFPVDDRGDGVWECAVDHYVTVNEQGRE